VKIDAKAALKALAALLATFVVIGGVSAALLPHSAFVDWGFLIGPGAWIVGALIASRFAGLGVKEAVVGSLVAVVPNAILGLAGLHWVGVVLGVVLFAATLGALAWRRGAVAQT
jgi:hypothetical protein